VLLFHTHDPTYPELGEWWELPGGGIAVRELREETGIAASGTTGQEGCDLTGRVAQL
jgi:8-oxo-dGTP pyrophosphatase MutT (NUDIX family)